MPTFSKRFRGVRNGEIYPKVFEAGDDCPPELERAARSVGAVEDGSSDIDKRTAADLKAELDAKGIDYKGNASKAELLALLAAAEA